MLQKATSQWCNEIILLVLFTCVGIALLCVGYASRVALVRLVYKRRFVYVQIQSEAVPKARANKCKYKAKLMAMHFVQGQRNRFAIRFDPEQISNLYPLLTNQRFVYVQIQSEADGHALRARPT